MLQLLIMALFLFDAISSQDTEFIVCANSARSIALIPEYDGPIESYQKCKTTDYCYTFWLEDPNNGSIVVMGQGCWELPGTPNECEHSECIANARPSKVLNNTKFCCCNRSKCNLNFSDAYVPVKEPPPEDLPVTHSIDSLIYITVGAVFSFFIMFLTTVSYFCWKMNPKKCDIENCQQPLPPPAEYSLDKLKMLNLIGQGRYGSVWRGTVEDQEVAVKVFPAHHRNYCLNEQDMYKIAGENAGLIKCYGGGEYSFTPGSIEYVLLLSLEQESLQEYLKTRTLDIITMGKMSLSIAKGLAHLHSDLGKYCIAHRDINSRNILVRSDLSCCICDLGLAVIPKRTENKSISEAGTLRYMAPEVLEGAVNLRDCESALKQIDVYALGLVLWELGTRCTDMQNAEPYPYTPPFAKEAGDNPTLEQMQALVSRKKVRPLWPVSWKDTASARLLCETAEDCWDQDAEARLTALCIAERLVEVPTLKGRSLHPYHPPASPTPLINNNHLHDHQFDASINTIETLLSPSEENCKNSNQLAVCVTPLQPYQGRNPCLERNLLLGSSDSLLIDKSSKHCSGSESQNLIPNDFLNFQINHRATPIPYLQNAVYGMPKQQNHSYEIPSKSLFKWNGFKNFLNSKRHSGQVGFGKDTQVKLNSKVVNGFGQNGVTTSLLYTEDETIRPSTLTIKPVENSNSCGVSQLLKRENNLSRQRSLDHFNEVFSSTSDLSRLKDPSQRVKTPGDVPPSVRRTRGKAATESARFSLYDDRMMGHTHWGSAPDLESQRQQANTAQIREAQDKDSMDRI
ncbi:activin receptor type-2A-like isoform X4 [Diabrotica undecimpunctata]|uniref:activin receptor type-2A-like isoform X4 n=1 Tax=Diabrotica undecimpunctata TaxID=50387 RepID=UPI003B636CC3